MKYNNNKLENNIMLMFFNNKPLYHDTPFSRVLNKSVFVDIDSF